VKKSVLVRFVGLLGLYSLIFVVLVSIQFVKKGTFSLRVYNLLAEGRYRILEEGEFVPYTGASPVSGDLRIVYGGLEFLLPGDSRSSQEDTLYLLDDAGGRYFCFAQYMAVEDGGIRFYLSGGTDLFFTAAGEERELKISGNFYEDMFTGLEIPYRFLRDSHLRDMGSGRFLVFADGREYRFNQSLPEDRSVLILQRDGSPVSYGPVGKEGEWRAEDYGTEEGKDVEAYQRALSRWVDRNYDIWGRIIPSRNEEDLVIAYGGEALLRGAFRGALASASRVFTSGSRQSYESSVYMGGMSVAYRGFAAEEAERLARIGRSLDEESPDFLLEDHVVEFLVVQGREELLNRGIALIRALDTPSLAQLPGLLEAQVELMQYRPQALEGVFDSLAARQEDALSKFIKRLALEEFQFRDLVLAFEENWADMELNLRLGKALIEWSEATDRESWGAVGRSIVLSVLSLEDREGRIVSSLNLNGQGSILPGENRVYVSAARFYRILEIGDYRPKILAVGSPGSGLWAWTASTEIRLAREGQVLDIAVSFPVGESHYMFIRGVDPFYRLQFYGMDWRSDPNFERYDSSGWVYHAAERILALKVKHRTVTEHIRLYLSSTPSPMPSGS
jgi:hypothetical protein